MPSGAMLSKLAFCLQARDALGDGPGVVIMDADGAPVADMSSAANLLWSTAADALSPNKEEEGGESTKYVPKLPVAPFGTGSGATETEPQISSPLNIESAGSNNKHYGWLPTFATSKIHEDTLTGLRKVLGRTVDASKENIWEPRNAGSYLVQSEYPGNCFDAIPLSQDSRHYETYDSKEEVKRAIATEVMAGAPPLFLHGVADATFNAKFSVKHSDTKYLRSIRLESSRWMKTYTLRLKCILHAVEEAKKVEDNPLINAFKKLNTPPLRVSPTLDLSSATDLNEWKAYWDKYRKFTDTYGTHVVDEITMGARVQMWLTSSSNEIIDAKEFSAEACVKLPTATECSAGVNVEMSKSVSSDVSDMDLMVIAKGGDDATRTKLVLAAGTVAIDNLIQGVLSSADDSSMVTQNWRPLWTLLESIDADVSENLEKYFENLLPLRDTTANRYCSERNMLGTSNVCLKTCICGSSTLCNKGNYCFYDAKQSINDIWSTGIVNEMNEKDGAAVLTCLKKHWVYNTEKTCEEYRNLNWCEKYQKISNDCCPIECQQDMLEKTAESVKLAATRVYTFEGYICNGKREAKKLKFAGNLQACREQCENENGYGSVLFGGCQFDQRDGRHGLCTYFPPSQVVAKDLGGASGSEKATCMLFGTRSPEDERGLISYGDQSLWCPHEEVANTKDHCRCRTKSGKEFDCLKGLVCDVNGQTPRNACRKKIEDDQVNNKVYDADGLKLKGSDSPIKAHVPEHSGEFTVIEDLH